MRNSVNSYLTIPSGAIDLTENTLLGQVGKGVKQGDSNKDIAEISPIAIS